MPSLGLGLRKKGRERERERKKERKKEKEKKRMQEKEMEWRGSGEIPREEKREQGGVKRRKPTMRSAFPQAVGIL